MSEEPQHNSNPPTMEAQNLQYLAPPPVSTPPQEQQPVPHIPLLLRQVRYSNSTHALNMYRLDENSPQYVNIGRHSTNDLVLYHRSGPIITSKMHAIIKKTDDGYFELMDIGARNGTFLNRVRMQTDVPVKLKDGDTILFAASEYLPSGEYNPFHYKVINPDSLILPPVPDTVELSETQFNAMKEDFMCGICFDYILNPFSLVCGHTTCGDCLANWFATLPAVKSCPTCRCAVTGSSPVPCKALDDIINTVVVPRLTLAERESRRDRMEIWNNRKSIINRRRPRPVQPLTQAQIDAQIAPVPAVDPMMQLAVQPSPVPPEVVVISDGEDEEPNDEGRNVRQRVA
jgi:hypothetical protein